jgi:acyl transferase domain-containing protein
MPPPTEADAGDRPPRAASPRRPTPIAVIGLACRFPGASTPDAFWRLLQGHDSPLVPAPASRWRWPEIEAEYPPQATTRRLQHGGFLPDLELFDADFFGLPDAEAERLDPQHRLALELSWEALESACLRPRDLAGSFTGVIMGVSHSDHAVKVLNDHIGYDGKEGLLAYECFVANRVSHVLDLKGPSYAVNSACASSLHALHVACQTLRAGDCDLVLSGGVNVDVTIDEIVSSAMAGWIAEDAQCRSFCEGGDGFVTGEGCGVVVLKRLDDALRDGDPVWGVIADSVLGHNGMSSRISWPSGNAQRDLWRRLLQRNGLAPPDIDALEAHGTGGAMSDRIEASAFTDVLAAGRDASAPLRVGCVKSHVGHLEAASGIAGLAKLLLALQHATLPPLRDFSTPNPAIRPHPGVRFLAQAEPWPRGGRPRRAVLANFSFGGANGVMLVEEAPAGVGPFDRRVAPGGDTVARSTDASRADAGLRLLALRARTEPGLLAMQGRLRAHREDRGHALDDDEIHTLNVHRSDLRQRAVLAGRGLAGLDDALRAGPDAALCRSADFAPAWRDAAPVLRLGAGLFGAPSADALARLRRGRLGGRLWDAWERELSDAAVDVTLEAALADDACRRRAVAAFWVRTMSRLGVPVRAVVAPPELAPAVALAWHAADADALRAWIDAGVGAPDGLPGAEGGAPRAAASPVPPVIAPVDDAAWAAWSAPGARASLVFAPMPVADLHRGDAPALGFDEDVALDPGDGAADADAPLARLLAGLFCLGADLRWSALGDGVKRPVPASPFDRRWSWFRPGVRRAPVFAEPASAAAPSPTPGTVPAALARPTEQT